MSVEKEREFRRTIKDQQKTRTPGPLPVLEGQDEKVHNELLGEVPDVVKRIEMMRKPGGESNALKHGAYSEELILPGEDAEAFESLHQELVAEWEPSGPSEDDAVLTLATCYWQKRRINSYFYDEATWLSEHPDFDEIGSFIWHLNRLDRAKTIKFAHAIIRTLPQNYVNFILPASDKSEYADEKKEIERLKELLLLRMNIHEEQLDVLQQTGGFKAETGLLIRDLMEKKMDIEERLDSRIDRAFKRLAQLKTLKQVIAVQASTTRIADQRSTSHQNQEVSGSAT